MRLALFSATFFALSIAASLPKFLPRTNWLTATGLAFLVAMMAGLFYFLARSVVAHRTLHLQSSLFWVLVDRLLVPISTWILYIRHAELQPYQAFANPVMVALLIVLFDPGKVFGKALSKAAFLTSGNFLRPIIPVKPSSSAEYFFPVLLLALLYWRLIL